MASSKALARTTSQSEHRVRETQPV